MHDVWYISMYVEEYRHVQGWKTHVKWSTPENPPFHIEKKKKLTSVSRPHSCNSQTAEQDQLDLGAVLFE